jgi:hypothetical protein
MVNIPPEIWSAVFLEVVELNPINLPSLMFVSRTWYRIASSSPRLWTQLVFKQPNHFATPLYANLFLTNSGARPLDVSIHVPPEVEDTSRLTALLRKHVSRFRTLVLCVNSPDCAEDLVSSIGDAQPAPLLERLIIEVATIEVATIETTALFTALEEAFQPAPRLTHLTLPAHPLPISSSLLSTVTCLTLDGSQSVFTLTTQEGLFLLASAPRLECLTFKGSCSIVDWSTEPVVPMPHLTSVDISVPRSGFDILCFLRAPLLRHVRYDVQDEMGYYYYPQLILEYLQLLSQESPMIESIELRSTAFPDATVDHLWLLDPLTFPHLEVLRLDSSNITDDALAHSPRGHPNLKRLELRCCSGVCGVGLRRFVEGCGEDFQLVIDGCAAVTQEDIRALSQVVKVVST